jgi:hypothetical protein
MASPIDSPTRELPPCKDCRDRIPGCHGSCARYKEWKQRLDELNKARKEYENKRNIAKGWL